MKKILNTLVSTTHSEKTSPGFSVGHKSPDGSTPVIPGREAGSKSAQAKVPCCRIWPNGEFGISYHTRTELSDPLPTREYSGDGLPSQTVQTGVYWSLMEQWVIASAVWDFLPWLVKSVKSAHRPETYGRQGITPYGQKMVRSGVHLMQDRYGKEHLSFLTLTVPRYGFEDECKIAGQWAYLTKTLMQQLRRRLRKAGLPGSIVLVTELQPKRLQGREPGALHLHLVFVGRHPRSAWAYSPREYRSLWLGLLSNCLGRTVPDAPCENVERVEFDASQYLSKYMSKGSESIADYAAINGWGMVPRQWWSASVSIKNAVKKRTISGELAGSILDQMIETWQKSGYIDNTEGFKFVRPITIKATKFQDYLIGFFGKLDDESYRDIRELVAMLKSA